MNASLARAQEPEEAKPPAEAQAPAVKPPVVLHHVDAVYPPSALGERKDADVVLLVTIDADGHVTKVDVAQSGGADLDEAAIVAARQWTFVPATRNGRAVASRIKMPFHFAPPAPPPEILEAPKGPGDVGVHQAVESAPPAPPAPPVNPEAEVVQVSGRSRPPTRGPSDFEIPLGELAAVPRANAADYLKLAPGVLVTNEGGVGHAESIILRGFDAGEGEDMEFSVGGVPINDPGNFHGNGYADTHFILPEVIESLRVAEGPYDPRQGNFAVAGSAAYELGLPQRGLTAKETVGSFGTTRTLLGWGPSDQGPHTFAVAEYAKSNGYGENRAFQSGTAIAQVEGKLGDHGIWRVTGQAYSVVSQAAGVIREDDYEAGRIGFYDTYDPNQGQDSSRYSIASDLQWRHEDLTLDQNLFFIDRATRIRESFTGFVTDAGKADARGTMVDLQFEGQSLGARGYARQHFGALGQPQELELGYFARGDAVDNVQRLVARVTQVPYATNASFSGVLGDLGVYGDASLKPLSWITLRGGVREEIFTYTVQDSCPQATDCDESPLPAGNPRTSLATSALLPRGSLLLGAIGGFTLVGSYGRGVRSLAIDEVAGGVTDLAKIDSYEGGISYAGSTPAGALTVSSVFYGTKVSRDQIFDPSVGRTVDTGPTSRVGWTGSARLTGPFYDINVNAAAVRGIVEGTDQPIPYVPHTMARADMAFFANVPTGLDPHPIRVTFAPAVTYVGVRSLPFGESSVAYALFDAEVKLDWRWFELGVAGTNLLDARYRLSEFTFVSDFRTQPEPTLAPERSFTAGAPRAVFVYLRATAGG